jgi:hypothetical protein
MLVPGELSCVVTPSRSEESLTRRGESQSQLGIERAGS